MASRINSSRFPEPQLARPHWMTPEQVDRAIKALNFAILYGVGDKEEVQEEVNRLMRLKERHDRRPEQEAS